MTENVNIVTIILDLITKFRYLLVICLVPLKPTCNNSILPCTKLISTYLNNCVQAST